MVWKRNAKICAIGEIECKNIGNHINSENEILEIAYQFERVLLFLLMHGSFVLVQKRIQTSKPKTFTSKN